MSFRIILSTIIIIIIFFQISCSRKLESTAEIVRFIDAPKNQLMSTYERNSIKVKLQWLPFKLISQKYFNNAFTKQLHANYLDKCFFVLSFSANDKELLKQLDYNSYSKLIQTMSFNMKAHIMITGEGCPPVYPLDCLFQNTYGMTESDKLLLVFDKKDLKNTGDFILHVQEFGIGLGALSFNLSTKNMEFIDVPDDVQATL